MSIVNDTFLIKLNFYCEALGLIPRRLRRFVFPDPSTSLRTPLDPGSSKILK
jgi:hypothetical protein